MPRTAKPFATCRLSLEIPEDARKNLEALRDKTQADSLTEVIRRALAVYDFLWNEKNKGAKLVVNGADGQKELVLL
ncbi:MAG: ribbon-helix-helix protein, CopG family [Planctomycetota bacterium]|jgi:hypothetical protein